MGHHEDSPPGHKAAFTRLYEATYADLRRFIERRVHASHAEDVLAQVYLVAWRRFADIPENATTMTRITLARALAAECAAQLVRMR